jgi:hypothetical protein
MSNFYCHPGRAGGPPLGVRSLGGLSGSPTFVHYEVPNLAPRVLQWYLIGMVHGHWDVPQEAFTDFEDSNEQINMGMAIVIPVNKVVDFVKEHPPFKQRRDGSLAAEKEKNLPTMD